MEVSASIAAAEFEQLFRDLERRGKRVLSERKQALSEAGDFLAAAIAGQAPVYHRPHYRYRKGGGRVATYEPGNLRRSIRRLPFKRSKDVWVGALLAKGSGSGYFSGSSADGYYAHFVNYGTVKQPANPFFDRGITVAAPVVLRLAIDSLKKIIEK